MAGSLSNIKIKELPEIKLGGGIDLDLDNIHLTELAPISVGVTSLPKIEVGVTELPEIKVGVTELPIIRLNANATLTSDSRVVTDNTIKSDNRIELDVRVRELPQFDLQLGFRPMRIHFPLGYRFSLNLFGVELFKLEACGESMVVIEDYSPRQTEECE